jgi:hypothetical protein
MVRTKASLICVKMHLLASILASTIVSALSAMGAPEEKSKDVKSWRELGSGAHSRIGTPQRIVIRTPDAWLAWWREHQKSDAEGSAPPTVDFDKETVLAATLGARKTGGFTISFAEIRKDGTTLKALLKTKSPTPGSMVTMAITKPFVVVAIPKHEGEVEFIDE